MSGAEPRERVFAWALVTPALAFTLLFFVLPLALMAAISLSDGSGGWGIGNYRQFFGNAAFFRAMVNSLQVTAIVTGASVLLAYPFAWILAERVPARFQRAALLLAVLPFWTSYVVRSYAWLLVLAGNGVINKALAAAGLVSQPLTLANTRFATVLGFVHFFVMLLTLTIFANLKQLSPAYAKAAADLGAGPLRIFVHVVLPLTLPGVVSGAFLTFVLAMGDYITPQILGGNNELLMPQLIMMQIGRRGDFPMASALSIVLMAAVTVGYLACARWLKIERA